MEEVVKSINEILTAIVGSDRTGWDIAVILFALTTALILISGRNTIIEALVGMVERRTEMWVKKAEGCILIANGLENIREDCAAILRLQMAKCEHCGEAADAGAAEEKDE